METYHDFRHKQLWCSDDFSPRSHVGWYHDDLRTIYIEETGRRFREHLRSTRQTNTDLPVHCYFSSTRHACTDRLASEIPKIGAASKPGSSSNTKRYIQEDLLTTLPSYKHPKSMRASHIEIVFDLNAYTRADLSLRAQNTSNSNFCRCHAHNSQLLFTADEEAAASKSGVFYVSSAQKSIQTSFLI